MKRQMLIGSALAALLVTAIAIAAFAQAPQGERNQDKKQAEQPAPKPSLFLREEWKQPPYTGALTDENRRVSQQALTNPNLELKVYGPCGQPGVGTLGIYGTPATVVPLNVWSGMCASPFAATLRDRSNYVDLTGPARIKWVFRANNLHALRPVVKLADGTLLVGNHADVTPTGTNEFQPQMVESEFAIAAVRWYRLNAETIATTRAADNPDLSKVDEIGWADLMAGGGHGPAGWVNMGPFEVYGKPVKR
jgi:hypothetical protein